MSLLLALSGGQSIVLLVTGVFGTADIGSSAAPIAVTAKKAVALAQVGEVTIKGADPVSPQYQFGAYGRDRIIGTNSGSKKEVAATASSRSATVSNYMLPMVAQTGSVSVSFDSRFTLGGVRCVAKTGKFSVLSETNIVLDGIDADCMVASGVNVYKVDNPRDEDIISILEELWI